jgi:transcriptional regulator with XRE-family HTH domain
MDLAQIGRNIKAEREARGWTQAALAAKVGGVGRHYVAAVEGGKVISLPMLVRFAKALGVPPAKLLL